FVGVLTVTMFSMHGALFLHLKTEGAYQERINRWIWHTWGAYLVMWNLTTLSTLLFVPNAVPNIKQAPWIAVFVVANVLAIANIPRAVFHKRFREAFTSSCVTIFCQVTLVGFALFPNLVTASNAAEPNVDSLTIYNAASSDKTL